MKSNMVSKEQREAIVNAVRTMYPGEDYGVFYLNLVNLMRNYSSLMAEHDLKYGDISQEEASRDLYTLETLMRSVEPIVIEDMLSRS